MAQQRQRRLVDRNAGEAVAMLPAREDIAQGVVDVEPRGIEDRIAVLADVQVGERRVRPAERHVAEAHAVPERRAESARHDELGHRMMRDGERKDDQHRDRDRAAQAACVVTSDAHSTDGVWSSPTPLPLRALQPD